MISFYVYNSETSTSHLCIYSLRQALNLQITKPTYFGQNPDFYELKPVLGIKFYRKRNAGLTATWNGQSCSQRCNNTAIVPNNLYCLITVCQIQRIRLLYIEYEPDQIRSKNTKNTKSAERYSGSLYFLQLSPAWAHSGVIVAGTELVL